jgi:peptidoglycan LD-endopeptidase CwlK
MKMSIEEVTYRQRFLRSAGFYSAAIDGVYGAKTDAANALSEGAYSSIARRLGRFDIGSELRIATLLPAVQVMARHVLTTARAAGYDVRVLSGARTYSEQTSLYAQGRAKPGPIVTNAKAGSSLHNFACAIDLGLFVNGKYSAKLADYDKIAKVVKADPHPEEWGGDWRTLHDAPHYQLTGGLSVGQLRAKWEAGIPFLPKVAG